MNFLKAFVLIATGSTLLAGCINYEQKTSINANGSGEMKIHYWTKESVVGWLSEGRLVFDEAELKERYGTNAKVTEAVVESEEKDSTRHVRVTLEFDDLNQLTNAKGFQGTKYSWVRDGDKAVFTQTMEANSSANGLGLEEFSVTYTYEFPGTVTSSNATHAEGNTLTWSYKLPELSKEITLTATMQVGGGMGMFMTVFVLLLIVIAGLVAWLMQRKKRRSAAE